jgi:O-antigen ligase
VLVELRLDAFHPWNGEYRFAGSVHPNLQASYCAVLCLAAICLASRQTAVRPLLIGLAVLGGGFLLLTKSRTTTMAFLVALAALGWVRSPSRRQITAGLLFGGLALALVLAVLLGCMDLGGSLVDVALMGRSEGAVSLTGRIPLWIELFDCVRDRLLFGFGYGSFWDPEHVLTASAVVGSGVSHAHSAYMETLVNVGLVGVVTLTFAVALAIGRTARECRHTRDAGCDFLFALLAYGAFQSLLESMFVDTACIPFLTACGLARLALAPADAAPRDGGHQRGADEHAFSGYGPSYPCRDSQP